MVNSPMFRICSAFLSLIDGLNLNRDHADESRRAAQRTMNRVHRVISNIRWTMSGFGAIFATASVSHFEVFIRALAVWQACPRAQLDDDPCT